MVEKIFSNKIKAKAYNEGLITIGVVGNKTGKDIARIYDINNNDNERSKDIKIEYGAELHSARISWVKNTSSTIQLKCSASAVTAWKQEFKLNEWTSRLAKGMIEGYILDKQDNNGYPIIKLRFNMNDSVNVGTNEPQSPVENYTGANNKIWFGAPGTGKSYNLKQKLEELIGKNNTKQYERVTFYPDYSYANFVGTYKPVSKGTGKIDYEYVPGPFIRVLEKALNDKSNPYVLVIEEINRANAAAVFGDMFQLLDRDKDGKSEYEVRTSEDLKKYLVKEAEEGRLSKDDDYSSIRIPSNMYIWATMNSADQGVFPMDTAFKRRWEFEYVSLDDGKTEDDFEVICREKKYKWSDVRKKINEWLLNHGVNEDKCLGRYFIKIGNAETIKYKVLMYLFEDAARMKRKDLFEENSFSKICKAYDEKGFEVFKKEALEIKGTSISKQEGNSEPSDAD